MEKYAKLLKGLEMCAGPECCKDGCPYYGETTGGMTCRARLLRDAEIAINNEQALHESAEEALAHRNEDVARLQADADNREAAYKTIRAERDKLKQEITCFIRQRDEAESTLHLVREQNKKLHAEQDALFERCQVQQNEINALLLKMGKQDGKTDRPSVCDKELAEKIGKLINRASYHEGRADALAEILARCSFGGGGHHE